MLFQVIVALLLGFLWWKWQQGATFRQMVDKFPGPRSYPIIGNALELGTNTIDFRKNVVRLCNEYSKTPFRIWVGSAAYVISTKPKDMEIILGSNKLLDKGDTYYFLHPWLGTGLLTSTGDKWRRSRKILTPTLHFKILEEFIDIFNANGEVLVEKLKQQVDGPAFDINKYVTLYALDNISETAMGITIDAQNDGDSAYVNAIRELADVVMLRSFKPWLQADFLFNFTRYKSIQTKSLKIVHDVTNSVIKRRRDEMTKEKANKVASTKETGPNDGIKKRLAFLDLLIESTFEGSLLTDEYIREEVDTFMFEGHDTTSSGISFCLWNLSGHQDIQDRVVQELEEVFPDPEEPISFRGLQDLKYMERVLKESLRLFPSVPVFSRKTHDELVLDGGYTCPKGTNVLIAAYTVHRNPDTWPEPFKFDPDRFLPENIQGRSLYAFVPFSAGPRNCIGQKFAMMELKSSLAHILRKYKVLPQSAEQDLNLAFDLILTSHSGIPVKITKRE